MILRKITFDNSDRYIPGSEKEKKEILNRKQKQLKLLHFLINETKTFHKLVKISLKM